MQVTPEIQFTKATIEDIDTLIEYRMRFLYEVQGKPAPEAEQQLKEMLKTYFEKALLVHSYISYIARYKNEVVGIGGMHVREQPGNFDCPNGKIGFVLNIYTVPEFRKNGICTEIVDLLVKSGKSFGLDRIDLYATQAGEPVYTKYGFKRAEDSAMQLKL